MHSLGKNENISMRGKRIAPQQKKLLPFLPGSLLKAFAAVFRLKELIFANEKHDSGMKFTCPEFCVPFA